MAIKAMAIRIGDDGIILASVVQSTRNLIQIDLDCDLKLPNIANPPPSMYSDR
jgi:hypothetical protein